MHMLEWTRRVDHSFRLGVLSRAWETLRASYWFLPTCMVVAASAAALVLLELDESLEVHQIRQLPWVQDVGPDGARSLLSSIAGSMITVTGVVFSITIVALTLASSQYGPRLLRNFLRDRGNQVVLGAFVATFLYSLLVLRAVDASRVPHVATAGAVALALACVFVLIYFCHHAATSIQASAIIENVVREIESALGRLFPERIGRGALREPEDEGASLRAVPQETRDVLASASGYVRAVEPARLIEIAVEHDLVVELVMRPGDFAIAGSPLARAGPAERAGADVLAALHACFDVGRFRTPTQDLTFLTDQLAEMAVRALSSGINDPNTAIACVHRLGAVLADVACREMPSPRRLDDSGRLRLVTRATRFSDIASSCLDPIRRYGARDAAVVEAALAALGAASDRCPDPRRRACLREHAREWGEAFARSDLPRTERERARVAASLARLSLFAPLPTGTGQSAGTRVESIAQRE
jgi:uncharacterized membrane protein